MVSREWNSAGGALSRLVMVRARQEKFIVLHKIHLTSTRCLRLLDP